VYDLAYCLYDCHDRDNIYSNINSAMSNKRIIQSVRCLFLSGQKLTKIQTNKHLGTIDSRKVISTLRKEVMKIKDSRLENHCKLYWHVNDSNQLSLFGKGCNDD